MFLFTRSYSESADAEWLSEFLDRYHNPKKYFVLEIVEENPTFQQLLDDFLLKHKLSEVRKKNFRVICRAMMSYELFVQATKRGQKSFVLDMRYPESSFGEIHKRIGHEINKNTIRWILKQMVDSNRLEVKGMNRWAKYSIAKNLLEKADSFEPFSAYPIRQ